MSVFNDSYVCTVGGQCIEQGIATVDDRIFCAKVLSQTTTTGIPESTSIIDTTTYSSSEQSSQEFEDSDSSLFGNSSSIEADLWWLWMLIALLLVACLLAMFAFKQRKEKKNNKNDNKQRRGNRHNSLAVASKQIDKQKTVEQQIDNQQIDESQSENQVNQQVLKAPIEKQDTDAVLPKTICADAVVDTESDIDDPSTDSDYATN